MSSSPIAIAAAAAPAHPPRPRRRWLRVVLWLIVFGSGFVAGTGITLIAVRRGVLDAVHHPETMPKKVAQRLRRPLRLSDEQTQRVEQILRERQQMLQRIRVRFQPEVEAELDTIDREISRVLDEGQRLKWQKLFHELRGTWLPPPPAPAASSPLQPQPSASAAPATEP